MEAHEKSKGHPRPLSKLKGSLDIIYLKTTKSFMNLFMETKIGISYKSHTTKQYSPRF